MFQRLQPPAVELTVLWNDLKIGVAHSFHRSRKAYNNNMEQKKNAIFSYMSKDGNKYSIL